MRNTFVSFVFGMALIYIVVIDSVYIFSVPRIEGGGQQLSAYQGKKMLIVTLPISPTNSADSFLFSLDTLSTARINTLKVVAVPSFEDGFTSNQRATLMQWYRSKLSSNILITDGVSVRRSSGSQQHPLFKWLTTMAENGSFDVDITEPGCKFFIDASGKVYGVLKDRSKMWGISVQRTLGIQ